ncbi:MKRN2 opposite strand protein isoform X2 [Macrobrachium rosenbergii]|uniref:MKRN2 opposite strand protein isoform X2 n=1 Tax=Macrobrachium rosenbergii TaxID=79674 RepID=UPI0034D7A7FC
MNLDPGIVCYQHCQGRLFAFSLPAACPLCRVNLENEPLQIPPFSDYKSTHDLHIGVTDSEGRVFEYEQEGLHSDYTSSWSQCLAIPIISDSSNRLDPVWQEYWDFTLNTLAKDPVWCEERYDETSFNCYSFVVEFLQRLAPPGLEVKTLSKTSLCSQLFLPYTIPAAKYISLYRSLLKEKVVPVQST